MTYSSPRISNATYRLQFNRNFTFRQAREIVPYLHQLGVSDVYASPYFQARAESLHGYDITDHNQLNSGIGSREDYDAFVAELHRHEMGQIVDFVPNHMGIGEPENRWWQDVLENGPSSPYANYFDIDWRPLKSDLYDKVLLPILGDQYGRVLERGELKVRYSDGSFGLTYFDHEFPLAPTSYRFVLDLALDILTAEDAQESFAELKSIRTALDYLPKRNETNQERIDERSREKEVIKRRLERRCAEAPAVLAAIERAVAQINGQPGVTRSFDQLDELLNDQAYRLAYWRVAAEEINFRRFFDVNDLAAIRMEIPEVFDAAHQLLLDLIAAGAVTGVRVDHPDGLAQPREYFEKLQRRVAERKEVELPRDGRILYLTVEKILTGAEELRTDWPVHGTTGYDFTNQVAGVLVDREAEGKITRLYHKFIGHSVPYHHLVYAKKRLVMHIALANDVNVLGSMLDRLSEQNRWFRDFTLESLRVAVRETIACFPVYRTYVMPGEPVSEEDRNVIEKAIAEAKRRNLAMDASVFDFLRNILLWRFPENLNEEQRAAHEAFVLKFQQTTGPITAKGIEDTAFYIYNRLVALNEVGGEPQRFGITAEEFHRRNSLRQEKWPSAQLATSTHDTKRSEDVRARILAIAEVPDLWARVVTRSRVANRKFKQKIDNVEAPDANEEYLLYQTLAGTWPVDASGIPLPEVSEDYIHRLKAYMGKALKEAKLNTSWIQPNAAWDAAMEDFVANILHPKNKSRFLPTFLRLVQECARLGAIKSLAQVVLKMTSPGVPDFYQGTEVWDDSLVDPDNRRPVDYERRKRLLAAVRETKAGELMPCWPDGRIKMWTTQRLLRFRREENELFREGDYVPLGFNGTWANCALGFTRNRGSGSVAIVVPRLVSPVGFPATGEKWLETKAILPDGNWRSVLCDRTFSGGEIGLAQMLAELPFVVLQRY